MFVTVNTWFCCCSCLNVQQYKECFEYIYNVTQDLVEDIFLMIFYIEFAWKCPVDFPYNHT